MTASGFQSLQDFFDSPATLAADFNLSASAAEPMTAGELLDLEPGSREKLDSLKLTYPERYGPEWMREKVASRYDSIGAGDVILTSGLDEALAMLFETLVDKGDRVIVMDPCYPPHLRIPEWYGAEVIRWLSRADQGWAPDLDELADLMKQPTKLVVVTLPQNPTGFMPDRDWLDQMVAIVRDAGAYLVSDEIYAGLSASDQVTMPNLASHYEKSITLHGLSKIYGLPGLRVGWMVTRDQAFFKGAMQKKNFLNAYFPPPVEYMAEIGLRHEETLIRRANDILKESVATARDFFASRQNLFDWTEPREGSISFPRWTGPGGAKALSDGLLAEAGVVFAPSTCFDLGDEHLRLCLARKGVAGGLERLDDYLGKLTA